MIEGTGIQLTVLAGPTVPVPLPRPLTEALESIEITRGSQAPAGFQLSFGLAYQTGAEKALTKTALAAFNRLIAMVTMGGKPAVLIDGIITNRQLKPGEVPGQATLTITGEDLAFVMDREERRQKYEGQGAASIATTLIGRYASYGLVARVGPPPFIDPPNPVEGARTQQGTDLAFLKKLAQEVGHVFYIEPGPTPGASMAYWGPPKWTGPPQPALTVNMGPQTNVDSVDFEHDAATPAVVLAEILDNHTNTRVPVPVMTSLRQALSSSPAWLAHLDKLKVRKVDLSGLSLMQALGKAQAVVDESVEQTVKATGTLDVPSYGEVLDPNRLVGLRGVGHGYDGVYFVNSVTHQIKRGEFKQQFELVREGLGSAIEQLPV